jgi:hypothetical protein
MCGYLTTLLVDQTIYCTLTIVMGREEGLKGAVNEFEALYWNGITE